MPTEGTGFIHPNFGESQWHKLLTEVSSTTLTEYNLLTRRKYPSHTEGSRQLSSYLLFNNEINSGDFGLHFFYELMKIDTQGMSGPADPNYKGKPLAEQQENLPKAIITPRRLFTESYVKEMKILINEVLDERQYRKELSQAVDNPTPPRISYFDVDHFKHGIDEPEPPYEA